MLNGSELVCRKPEFQNSHIVSSSSNLEEIIEASSHRIGQRPTHLKVEACLGGLAMTP